MLIIFREYVFILLLFLDRRIIISREKKREVINVSLIYYLPLTYCNQSLFTQKWLMLDNGDKYTNVIYLNSSDPQESS